MLYTSKKQDFEEKAGWNAYKNKKQFVLRDLSGISKLHNEKTAFRDLIRPKNRETTSLLY